MKESKNPHRWVEVRQCKTVNRVHDSTLRWSCGPCLPKLLSDHQIVLCGGPVVFWKLLTIKKQHFELFTTFLNVHRYFLLPMSYLFQKHVCNVRSFQMSCTGPGKFCQLCLILPKTNYIRMTCNLAGPPDFQGWSSDGPLSRNVNF